MSEANDYVDFISRWQKLRELNDQIRGDNLRIVIDALKSQNVTMVEMTYSGGGDSGEYHYPVYTVKKGDETVALENREGYGGSSYRLEPASGEFISETKITISHVHPGDWDPETKTQGAPRVEEEETEMVKAVYQIMEEAVESQHGGWYNNEGGEGSVQIDVFNEKIDVEHGDYVMETVWNSYSIEASAKADTSES